MAVTENDAVWGFNGGRQCNLVGIDIASAATVAPVNQIHLITGTAAIVNITLPYTGFQGTLIFLPAAAFTWTAAGNIAVLGTAVALRAVMFTYNPTTAKFYPSYV